LVQEDCSIADSACVTRAQIHSTAVGPINAVDAVAAVWIAGYSTYATPTKGFDVIIVNYAIGNNCTTVGIYADCAAAGEDVAAFAPVAAVGIGDRRNGIRVAAAAISSVAGMTRDTSKGKTERYLAPIDKWTTIRVTINPGAKGPTAVSTVAAIATNGGHGGRYVRVVRVVRIVGVATAGVVRKPINVIYSISAVAAFNITVLDDAIANSRAAANAEYSPPNGILTIGTIGPGGARRRSVGIIRVGIYDAATLNPTVRDVKTSYDAVSALTTLEKKSTVRV
jgi:hypothetical protein